MSRNIENDSRYRAACLGALLARHYPAASPHSIALVVVEMQIATSRAKKFAADCCTYNLGDPDDAQSSYARRRRAQDRREDAINRRLMDSCMIAPEFWTADSRRMDVAGMPGPARIDLGGDPRGACGRLLLPGQRGDGWGDGFAIY